MQASRIKGRWPVAQQQVRNFLERSHVEGWNGPQSRRRQPRQLSSPSSLPFLFLNRTKKTALYVRHCCSIKNRDTNCIRLEVEAEEKNPAKMGSGNCQSARFGESSERYPLAKAIVRCHFLRIGVSIAERKTRNVKR